MTINDAVRVRVIRAITGMDSKTMAARLGIGPATLTSWEKGRATPLPGNRDALAVVCQEHGIGFTPSGFPFPMVDCMQFKQES